MRNESDKARAQIRSGMVDTTGAILEVGVPASTMAAPSVGRGVAKSGRTTGLTCSTIGSINTSVKVQYQKGCNSGRKFTVSYTGQVVINSSSFSAGGDSGSLIVTSDTAQPTALLFAGSSTTTIGNPIQEVSSKLGGVTFVGGSTHSVSCTGAAAATATAGAQEGVAPEAHEIDRVSAIKERHAPGLMRDPAIIAVGIGVNPANPIEAVMVVYLDQHRQPAQAIPAQLDGAKVVVYKTDTIRAYGWNEDMKGASCSRN